ncbi:oxidoreductase molybdopterin binding protein [Arcobacter nitrofigilis DSM 7299]|uniref:Protein-methionine-sulfoxide reductase catalytic subunit MsrP n=1 Tax=Arcobacter nitrofigilis (strain ATCC 33309 / DSM 7299 / CCUG 15893 / LMG 7604 / NCTC 12251 / CI) TaxID=572480 RepID=D5V2M8_ARCNC|nr:protein-methionine-sulfoxide reductase catalytic subunit MsrP [Arcobacter nitrofigilis]ADG92460.1 oxidoreductase molybdopterin binding protein [Arcobacter nitrofigilis DSM 7299]
MKINENEITPKELFEDRRKFIKLGAASVVASSTLMELMAKENLPTPNLTYKKDINSEYLKLNSFEQITSYNNFYEFTTSKKDVKYMAHTLKPNPWAIEIDGLVEKPFTIDIKDLISSNSLEERIYRFRCVEGWSMVVPWVGFELAKFIKKCKPLSDAKYVKFETKYDEEMFPDQERGVFANIKNYPYVEGLRMDEAMNPLTILAVGLYGKTLENQNGAPIRLVVPWKYGFKSIKSIAKISFVKEQPLNTWQDIASNEYGFYANVNPKVDHPRWSQARERVLGKFLKQDTLMFNGYEKEVAYMYKGMDLRKNF